MSLVASHVSFAVNQKTILNDVSMSLRPGVFTAVVGPNGAGKSTLLKILSGEKAGRNGDVLLLDRKLSTYKPKELSKVRSVLSQQVSVAFPFSVEEVIELGLHIHRLTRSEIDRIVTEVMKETGVSHLNERLYPTLSGGEQQRVQLARAVAQIWEDAVYPRYLLLDEPTNNLDLSHQHTILYAARKMCSRNFGVMAIIHDLNLAAQYADEIIFMKEGSIYVAGSPETVMTKTIIEEVFNHAVRIYYDVNETPFVVPVPNGETRNNKQRLTHTVNGQLNFK